jgi:phosphoribosylformylglycinamidine cyclo-ligase
MSDSSSASAYRQAGVNLEASDQTLALIKQAVKSTYNQQVLAGLGAFGGLYDAAFLKEMASPVLVASTDGVGTKTKLAAQLGQFNTIGFDIVHHCINDILVQAASPLFFMDYIASAKLEPSITASIISSVAYACKATSTVLLGGETAEMPGVYSEGDFDLVGTIIGVVDKEKLVTGHSIEAGDVVLALMSHGLQTNGFSLARKALGERLNEPFKHHTVGLELLTPHRHYLQPVNTLKSLNIKGMAHITGGGIPGNLPRILPTGLGAQIKPGSWPVPDIFRLLQHHGTISEAEMYQVFNMGAGFLLVVSPEDAQKAQELCPEPLYKIGIILGQAGVELVG